MKTSVSHPLQIAAIVSGVPGLGRVGLTPAPTMKGLTVRAGALRFAISTANEAAVFFTTRATLSWIVSRGQLSPKGWPQLRLY